MAITAALVKELRERTGSGMMECKKALVQTDGDIEAAVELMRKAGQAKADKKAGRIAAEGRVVLVKSEDSQHAVLVEINCETDFVAKDDNFVQFATEVADKVLSEAPANLEDLQQFALADGITIEETRRNLIAKIGENIGIRRFQRVQTNGILGGYSHGARIGVLVDLEGGDEEVAKDIAMHVAASRPICVDASQVPVDLLEKEREIYAAQAQESGKPPEIIEKMVDGRIKKYLKEVTLLGQPFVKDPDQTVEKYLKSKSAKVNQFLRFEVGEGIEKKTENFAEEVMAQAKGN